MDIRKYFQVVKTSKAPEPTNKKEEDSEENDPKVHWLDDESWIEQGRLPLDMTWDFDKLWCLHPEEFGEVRYMGKIVKTPRWQQTYCRSYYYSGMMHEALALPAEFRVFLDWANGLYRDWTFNQVLVNWYLDGRHYISKHSDGERQIVPRSPIVSVSLGQSRCFRVRRKGNAPDDEVVFEVDMPDRSFLAMCGAMQEHFTHEVPKVNGAKGASMGRRINITFRVFA